MASRSREFWLELQARNRTAEPLWHESGVLWLAAEDDAYAAATRQTLERGGYPVIALDRGALRSRYPHLVADGVQLALLEPACGVLMARRAVRTLADELTRSGVVLRRGRVIAPLTSGPVTSVRLSDGTEISGDLFVFACGPWLPSLFPELLGRRIRPTRQVVMYFGTPSGDERFSAPRTPAWLDFSSGVYGLPDVEGRGLKVGLDAHGAPFDPDTGDRTIDAESVEKARSWLRLRLPALSDAPLVESRVCQYENTSTGDFLIDRHPDFKNVWIVGGGSGHGFKHGPAVGEYVMRLISGDVVPEQRFSLQSKGVEARRVIY